MAAEPKTSTAAPKAPGPGVVEALASPMYARFTQAALTEASEALRERYTAEGRSLAPTQAMTLDTLTSLGAQLVTATTPTGGAS